MIEQFVVDPPWPKKKGGKRSVRPKQTRALAYVTMSVVEIFDLLDTAVFTEAAPVHNVFLWSIDQFLHAGEEEMITRGYRLHARFVWDKENGVAPAFTIRYAHEYLCWFYKPKLLPVAQCERGKFTTVIREKAREHSRKPDSAYTMIDRLYPTSLKLDVFSRESRRGWEQFGDQPQFFQKEG